MSTHLANPGHVVSNYYGLWMIGSNGLLQTATGQLVI